MLVSAEIRDFLSLLAQGLLIIALPIVIAAAVQLVRVQVNRLNRDKLETIMTAVRMAVGNAERLGLTQGLTGPEKRAEALRLADAFLRRRGIKLDLEELARLIEGEVMLQFRDPQPPADTPEARQELIHRAIEAAVLAAEQAGVAGMIENVGRRKKAHALKVAAQYLNALDVEMPAELASNLIEAQVLRFRLAVRGQLPPSPAPPPPPPR